MSRWVRWCNMRLVPPGHQGWPIPSVHTQITSSSQLTAFTWVSRDRTCRHEGIWQGRFFLPHHHSIPSPLSPRVSITDNVVTTAKLTLPASVWSRDQSSQFDTWTTIDDYLLIITRIKSRHKIFIIVGKAYVEWVKPNVKLNSMMLVSPEMSLTNWQCHLYYNQQKYLPAIILNFTFSFMFNIFLRPSPCALLAGKTQHSMSIISIFNRNRSSPHVFRSLSRISEESLLYLPDKRIKFTNNTRPC